METAIRVGDVLGSAPHQPRAWRLPHKSRSESSRSPAEPLTCAIVFAWLATKHKFGLAITPVRLPQIIQLQLMLSFML